jgi:membrane associated rhomboid family serine protease
MKNASHTIGQELRSIVAFVGVVWAVFILDWVVYPIDFNAFGLIPRTLFGTVGIVSMPFLHANLGHLLSNKVFPVRTARLAGRLQGEIVGNCR